MRAQGIVCEAMLESHKENWKYILVDASGGNVTIESHKENWKGVKFGFYPGFLAKNLIKRIESLYDRLQTLFLLENLIKRIERGVVYGGSRSCIWGRIS